MQQVDSNYQKQVKLVTVLSTSEALLRPFTRDKLPARQIYTNRFHTSCTTLKDQLFCTRKIICTGTLCVGDRFLPPRRVGFNIELKKHSELRSDFVYQSIHKFC